jgi:type III secretory pathway component EscV
MDKEFIDVQIIRIKRNIIILSVCIILLAIFIAFNKGIGLMFACILLGIFILNPRKFIAAIRRIKYHTLKEAVSVYGEFDYVVQNINWEVKKQSSVKYKNLILTDNWILKLNTFSLDVIKITDVVWAYIENTRHEEGIIIPGAAIPPQETGNTFAVIINTANPIIPTIRISTTHMSYMGDSNEVELEGIEKKQRMANILEELQQRNSCAVFGYSRELAKMWAEDRKRFIEEVKLALSE